MTDELFNKLHISLRECCRLEENVACLNEKQITTTKSRKNNSNIHVLYPISLTIFVYYYSLTFSSANWRCGFIYSAPCPFPIITLLFYFIFSEWNFSIHLPSSFNWLHVRNHHKYLDSVVLWSSVRRDVDGFKAFILGKKRWRDTFLWIK